MFIVCNIDTNTYVLMQSCFKRKHISSSYKQMHLMITVREGSYEMTVKIRKQSLDMPLGPLLPLENSVVNYDRATDGHRDQDLLALWSSVICGIHKYHYISQASLCYIPIHFFFWSLSPTIR